MLVLKLTFVCRSGLYWYFVCTESDCTNIDIQCTKTGCIEKRTENICTKIVMYRKRPALSRQITSPISHHSVFTGRIPFLLPNQQRQSISFTQNSSCHAHIHLDLFGYFNTWLNYAISHVTNHTVFKNVCATKQQNSIVSMQSVKQNDQMTG